MQAQLPHAHTQAAGTDALAKASHLCAWMAQVLQLTADRASGR